MVCFELVFYFPHLIYLGFSHIKKQIVTIAFFPLNIFV